MSSDPSNVSELEVIEGLHDALDVFFDGFVPVARDVVGNLDQVCVRLDELAGHVRGDDALPKELVCSLLEFHTLFYGRIMHVPQPQQQDLLDRMPHLTDLMLGVCGWALVGRARPHHPNVIGDVRSVDLLERGRNLGDDDVVGVLLLRTHAFIEGLRAHGPTDRAPLDDLCVCLREVVEAFRGSACLPKDLAFGLLATYPLVEGFGQGLPDEDADAVTYAMIIALELMLEVCGHGA